MFKLFSQNMEFFFIYYLSFLPYAVSHSCRDSLTKIQCLSMLSVFAQLSYLWKTQHRLVKKKHQRSFLFLVTYRKVIFCKKSNVLRCCFVLPDYENHCIKILLSPTLFSYMVNNYHFKIR